MDMLLGMLGYMIRDMSYMENNTDHGAYSDWEYTGSNQRLNLVYDVAWGLSNRNGRSLITVEEVASAVDMTDEDARDDLVEWAALNVIEWSQEAGGMVRFSEHNGPNRRRTKDRVKWDDTAACPMRFQC